MTMLTAAPAGWHRHSGLHVVLYRPGQSRTRERVET